MPTYSNTGSTSYIIVNTAGDRVTVATGDTVQTYRYQTGAGLTLTSHEPYYNPNTAQQAVTSTGPGDDQIIELDAETDSIQIINDSDSDITVFRQSVYNAPGDIVPGRTVGEIEGLKLRCTQIVLRFSAAAASGVTLTEVAG